MRVKTMNPSIFKIDPHATFVVLVEDENELPSHPDPLPPGGEVKSSPFRKGG